MFGLRRLGRLDFPGQSFGQLLDIRPPEGGHRDFLLRGIKGHRFQRRFFRQRVRHGTRQTTFARGMVVT